MAKIYCRKDPLPIVRLIVEVVGVEILLMDQQIVEAVILPIRQRLHIAVNVFQLYFIDDDIVLYEDDILTVLRCVP